MSNPEIIRLKNSITEQDHASGLETAPVTLLEYGNFECIHCGRAYPVIKEIRRLLGDDLHFVFRNFPTVRTHPHAIRAAEAAESAAAQGKGIVNLTQQETKLASWVTGMHVSSSG